MNDVSAGDKIAPKDGPGITKSDLLIINRIDIAEQVYASLELMEPDSRKSARRAPFRVHQLIRGGRAGEDHQLHFGSGHVARAPA